MIFIHKIHNPNCLQAMVNAAGILSIRAEDTGLDHETKRRVSIMYLVSSYKCLSLCRCVQVRVLNSGLMQAKLIILSLQMYRIRQRLLLLMQYLYKIFIVSLILCTIFY